MKLRVLPDGTVEFDDVDLSDARTLIADLRNGRAKATPKGPVKRGRPPHHTDVADLNEVQMQTWRWLVAHDTEEGVTTSDYVTDAKLMPDTARERLKALVDLGLARRMGTGPATRWRAGVES